MAMYNADERLLMTAIVLQNRAVAEWCKMRRDEGIPVNPTTEMSRLVGCLDLLVAHYQSEVEGMAREVPI
jgi:hypothetical protein